VSAAAGGRIRGVAASLPAGEQVRWQGAPEWRSLAVHVFHLRKLAVYFGLLVAWRAVLSAGEARPVAYFATGAVTLAACFAAAAGMAVLLAVLSARSTTYAITDRRLVLQVGMVMPATVNVPLSMVESAGVKPYRDGTGDLAVRLEGGDRLAYFLLWPHARPWRFNPTEPALRCIRAPAAVGEVLRQAVAERVGVPLAAAAPAPVRAPLREPALAGD
jgi:hypothetical protein